MNFDVGEVGSIDDDLIHQDAGWRVWAAGTSRMGSALAWHVWVSVLPCLLCRRLAEQRSEQHTCSAYVLQAGG